jgi:4-amino-4-deoxy-L-arabinose transferase-like glycosyltransferase
MIPTLDQPPRPARLSPAMLAALALCACWWLWWAGRSALFFDEAYYWDWSRHLAFGYFDHPPLAAWLIRLSTTLLGESAFAVRLPVVVCGVGAVAFVARAGLLLGGTRAAWLCLGFAAACPLFGLLSCFAAPDAPLLLCWTGALYAALRAGQDGHGRHWYAVGIWLGLALLAKYVAALLALSLLLYALVSRRRWLRRREPYLAVLVAVLLFSPNLWWNAQHGWVSVGFQSAHGVCVSAARAAGYPYQTLLYAQNQVTLLGPLLALAAAITVVVALRRGWRGDDALLLLTCCTLPTVGLFFFLHGVRHWAAPGYLSATIAAGVLLAQAPAWTGGRRWPRFLAICVILAGALEFAMVQAGYEQRETTADAGGWLLDNAARVDSSLLRPQPRWPEAARLVAVAEARLPASRRRFLVLVADSYGTAAEMAFYLPGHPTVYSGANQYGLWPAPPAARNVLYLSSDLTPGTQARIEGRVTPLVDMLVRSGGRVAGHFTAGLAVNRRLPGGESLLADLLARTQAGRQHCQ